MSLSLLLRGGWKQTLPVIISPRNTYMSDALYNNARIKSDAAQSVGCPKTAGALIKGGDLVILVSGAASPASDAVWSSSLAGTQEDTVHDQFAGVAIDASLAAETRPIEVCPSAICEYPCVALGGGQEIGAYVGVAQLADGSNGVERQVVAIVATANLAIGRLTKRALVGDTTLTFRMSGVLTTAFAGAQALA